MNTISLRLFAFSSILSIPLIAGCNPANSAPLAAETNQVAETRQAAASKPTQEKPTSTNAPSAEPVQPEVPFVAERPIPAELHPSEALREVIKLAQAGVDEQVLLSFVGNSSTSFMLGADEIIYLTDIGVAPQVINSMMERDKVAKAAPFVPPAPARATETTPQAAAAPTYVTPPAAAQAEPVPQATEVNVTENHFYEALAPYGTWIEVEGYGRCWQPSVLVANRNWRPYLDGGRWIYSDNGWYWYSDYSWGWAPFHYGRWFSHARWGWCWAPGYTWGPAWVTWSYTDSYCGWAPLPPAAIYTGAGFTYYGSSVSVSFGFGLGYGCYSYVPWVNFCDYRPWRYCAPRPHCSEIYSHATCHNDYSTDRNHRAVNRGLPPERVSAYSRSEVRRVAVREVAQTQVGSGRRDELSRDGRTLEIRRPVASAQPRGTVQAGGERSGTGPNQPSLSGTTSPRIGSRGDTVARPVTHAESSTHVSPAQPVGRGETDRRAPSRPAAGQPLVVIGNGDAQPQVTGHAPPRTRSNPQPEQSGQFAEAQTGQPHTASTLPPSQWSKPGRADSGNAGNQVVRVGRGIEDRPSGSPNYRVYSSPQPQPPSAPAYGAPEQVQTPAPSRPTHKFEATRSNDDVGNNAPSVRREPPSRPQTYEQPRQVERIQERSAPQRTEPSRPTHVESRPAPQPERSAPARSESRQESRPSSNDSKGSSRR